MTDIVSTIRANTPPQTPSANGAGLEQRATRQTAKALESDATPGGSISAEATAKRPSDTPDPEGFADIMATLVPDGGLVAQPSGRAEKTTVAPALTRIDLAAATDTPSQRGADAGPVPLTVRDATAQPETNIPGSTSSTAITPSTTAVGQAEAADQVRKVSLPAGETAAAQTPTPPAPAKAETKLPETTAVSRAPGTNPEAVAAAPTAVRTTTEAALTQQTTAPPPAAQQQQAAPQQKIDLAAAAPTSAEAETAKPADGEPRVQPQRIDSAAPRAVEVNATIGAVETPKPNAFAEAAKAVAGTMSLSESLAEQLPTTPGAERAATSARAGSPVGFAPPTVTSTLPAPDALVAQVTRQMTPGGASEMMIRLDPPELGSVRIGLTVGDGTVAAVVSTDRPDVEALLRRNGEQLTAALQAAGYDDVDLSFSDRSAGEQAFSDTPEGELDGTQTGIVAALPAQTLAVGSPIASSGLDLRL